MAYDEYLLVSAERGGHRHRTALLYSSATDNAVYKLLATQVEHIFFNGPPYLVNEYAHGIDKPVGSVDDFHAALIEWNRTSVDGKFIPASAESAAVDASGPQDRVLLSEEPIQAIWLRIRQLQSVTLARKLIARRAQADPALTYSTSAH